MMKVQKEKAAAICPFCRGDFDPQLAGVRCSGCGTVHHETCWRENNAQCTVYACPGKQTLAVAMSFGESAGFAWLSRLALLLPVLMFAWFFFSHLIFF